MNELAIERIKELSREGEEDYNINLDDTLDVPHGENETNKTFKIEDVKECFNKVFAIRELISLVGSTIIHKDEGGNDVDLILSMSDLSEDLQIATKFRLMRGFSSYFNIPYEEVPKYLHLHEKEGNESSFTDWLPIYKLALIPTPNEERTIRKMSLDNESDDENFEIIEKSKRRIIGGIATTSIIDRMNEEISPRAIKKIWEHIKKLPENYLNLMIQHESTQIGVLLKDFRNRKMALLDGKIYVIAEIRQDIPLADKVWKDILSKKIHSLSIKINIPKPLKKNLEEICDDERCWTRINDARFLEVSLVADAANPDCEKLDILSKEDN